MARRASGGTWALSIRNRVARGPEIRRVSEAVRRDTAQIEAPLVQQLGFAAEFEGLAIAFQNHGGDVGIAEAEIAGGAGHPGAGRQTDQVVGPGKSGDFVEVVGPEDEPALGVLPGSEVLDVNVTQREHRRGAGRFGAMDRKQRRPPIVGGSQEVARPGRHPPVLERERGAIRGYLPAEPRLVTPRLGTDAGRRPRGDRRGPRACATRAVGGSAARTARRPAGSRGRARPPSS